MPTVTSLPKRSDEAQDRRDRLDSLETVMDGLNAGLRVAGEQVLAIFGPDGIDTDALYLLQPVLRTIHDALGALDALLISDGASLEPLRRRLNLE